MKGDLIHTTNALLPAKIGDYLIVFRDEGILYGNWYRGVLYMLPGDQYAFRIKKLKNVGE